MQMHPPEKTEILFERDEKIRRVPCGKLIEKMSGYSAARDCFGSRTASGRKF